MRRQNFWQVYHENTARLPVPTTSATSPNLYGYFTVQNEMLAILVIALIR